VSFLLKVSRYSDEVTGWIINTSWFEFRHRHESFLFSAMSRPAPGPTQPPIERIPLFLSPEIKWPECEADLSLPHNDEVKNAWSKAFTSPFTVCTSINLPIKFHLFLLTEATS